MSPCILGMVVLTMNTDDRVTLLGFYMESWRKVVAIFLAVVGVAMIFIGLAHNIVGLRLVLEATQNGGINLPSIRDTGVGIHLSREPIIYGHLFMGVDTCVFGAILLLCAPELVKGRRSAWRICMLIGLTEFVGYTVVWIVFEHAHLRPLVMPSIGLMILVPLVHIRRGFTIEEQVSNR